MFSLGLFTTIDGEREAPAVEVGGFKHDGEALDYRFCEADVADISVICALIHESFGADVFFDDGDFRIFGEFNAIGPCLVEILRGNGFWGGWGGCFPKDVEFCAGQFHVFPVAWGKFGEGEWDFTAIFQLEHHRIGIGTEKSCLNFPVLNVGPCAEIFRVCDEREKGRQDKKGGSHGS